MAGSTAAVAASFHTRNERDLGIGSMKRNGGKSLSAAGKAHFERSDAWDGSKFATWQMRSCSGLEYKSLAVLEKPTASEGMA